MLKTVDLSLQVLQLFTHERASWRGREIAKELDQHYSSIYRILKTLEKQGFLKMNPQTNEYTLGLVVWQLGQTMYKSLKLEELIRPLLIQLKEEVGESVFFTARKGLSGVAIMAEEPVNKVKYSADLGVSVPLYPGASYRAILAYQSEEMIQAVINDGLTPFTPNTITDPDALWNELDKVRINGYAKSEGELTPDVIAYAVPVRNYENNVEFSVTVSGPSYRMKEHDEDKLIHLVKQTGLNIEKRLRNVPLIL